MHASSILKLRAFLSIHKDSIAPNAKLLDVGSASYLGHYTYREDVEKAGLRYVGLDMQAGHNVDIVSSKPCIYAELENESFDFIISGQTFEHNPFFWISFCEMARVLKQGGHMLIIAPGGGGVHRYPFDCWRFYPDAWAPLCSMSGLEVVETIAEPEDYGDRIDGSLWRDSAVVARKPVFGSTAENTQFYQKIASITAPFWNHDFDVKVVEENKGPVFATYMESALEAARLREAVAQSTNSAPMGR